MTVYLGVLIVSVSLATIADNQAQVRDGGIVRPRRYTIATVLVFLVLTGVSSLRWRVGTDYWAYEALFETYVIERWTSLTWDGEPGLRWLSWVSYSIGSGSAGMFALAAILTIGLSVHSYWRWSPTFAFTIATFVLFGAYTGSFNGVRQYVAAAIVFAGHRYVVDRRPIRWVLVVAVASLFHVSALVALFIYFVPRKRLSVPVQLAILLAALAVMLGTSEILELLATEFDTRVVVDSEYATRDVHPLRVAFHCVPLVLMWLLRPRSNGEDEGDGFYRNMIIVYTAAMIGGAGSAYLTRFVIYPGLFIPISLAVVTMIPDRRERTLVHLFLGIAMGVFFYADVSGIPNLANFQWIFNRS